VFADNGPTNGLAVVGSVPAGAAKWGQQDLAGNLFELVFDWYGTYPTATSTNYAKVSGGTLRVMRGGSFVGTLNAPYLRTTARLNLGPATVSGSTGFRCARPALP
jgi:formylglycine-generating enzyme required for sulfatase activity